MKKLVSVFLAVLFALGILPVGALANSGPTYMPSAPGMQLTVDKNSPITVEHESLKFDFTTLEYNDWSPTAEVTASYEMKNPTDEALSVMMAFPTISRMSDAGIHSVHADGAPVDFEMYFGAEVKSNTERIDNTAVTEYDLSVLDLDDVLSSVLTECPPEPADGTLYTITFSAGDGIELEEDRFYANLMISPPDGTRVIFDGFGGYSYDADSGNITLDSYVYQREDVMHLYVIEGRDIGDISAEAFVAHDSKAKLDGVDIDITAQTMSLYEYVKTFGGEGFSDARYWCFLEYELDRALENYNGVAPIYDAWSGTESYPRLGMAVYTVDFEPGETKNVTVVSSLSGTMRCPSGYSSIGMTHTYTYLSNPAKNWASFGTIDITVKTPEDMPVSSSIPELTANGDGTYTAFVNGLPEENISFVIGEEATEEELRELERQDKARNARFFISMFGGFIVIIILVILLVVLGIVLYRKKKRGGK